MNRHCFAGLLFTTLVLGATTRSASAEKPWLSGVVHLLSGSQTVRTSESLGKAGVSAFRVRVSWDQVQPTDTPTGCTPGVNCTPNDGTYYDWSIIDDAIACVNGTSSSPCNVATGQKLSVSISAGVNTPQWVYDAGAEPIDVVTSGNDVLPMPLPWDSVYKMKWYALIAAFGARYDANPTVAQVFFSGHGPQVLEFHVVTDEEDIIEFNSKAMEAGYMDKSDAIRQVSVEVVDKFVEAFPNTPTLFTGGNPWGGGMEGDDDEAFVDTYVTSGSPDGIEDGIRGLCKSTLKAWQSCDEHPLADPCWEDDGAPVHKLYPSGDQAIQQSTSNIRDFYAPENPVPFPTPPVPLRDLCEHEAISGGTYVEVYAYDLADARGSANDAMIELMNARLAKNLPPESLTVIFSNTAAGTLGTANQFVTTDPGTEVTNVNSTYPGGNATGYAIIPAQGGGTLSLTPGTPTATTPAADGKGWLWDVTTLEGKKLVAGDFTPLLRIRNQRAATLSVYLRLFKRSNAGPSAYTSIGVMSQTGISAGANSTIILSLSTLTTVAAVNFSVGDKLYADVVINWTAGAGQTGNIGIVRGLAANEQIATPGYDAQ